MHTHKFPMPLWNDSGVSVTIPKEIIDQLGGRPTYGPAEILYAPNERLLAALRGMSEGGRPVWSDRPVITKFPMALHGPNNQSLKVKDENEMKRALKNGWSLKPVVVEQESEAPPSPDRAPKDLVTA